MHGGGVLSELSQIDAYDFDFRYPTRIQVIRIASLMYVSCSLSL